MNAKKTESPSIEPTTELLVDPNLISTLTDQVSRLRSITKDLAMHTKAAHERYVFVERYLREFGGSFMHGKSAEALQARCKVTSSRHAEELIELRAAMAAMDDHSTKAESLKEEEESLQRELRELLKKEGSALDAQLTAAHKALVAKIAARILPECAHKKEAELIARGMEIPTTLHRKIYSWGRGVDLLNAAQNFISTLKSLQSEVSATEGK